MLLALAACCRHPALDPTPPNASAATRLEGGARAQEGINTRLFRKADGRWVIALNHVSAREPAS